MIIDKNINMKNIYDYVNSLKDKEVLLKIIQFYTQGDVYNIDQARQLLVEIMDDDTPDSMKE